MGLSKESSLYSTLETNFVRLLHCTEELANGQKYDKWRFYVYVDTLQQYLDELLSSHYRPPAEYVRHYELRLHQLKRLKELSLQSKPAQQNPFQLLPPFLTTTQASTHVNEPASLSLYDAITSGTLPKVPSLEQNVGTIKSPLSLGDVGTVSSCAPTEQVLLDAPDLLRQERCRLNREMRAQLLEPTGTTGRAGDDGSSEKEHFVTSAKSKLADSQLLHQETLRREKLAAEMLGLTRNLKNQSAAMGERLRSDMSTIQASVHQADRNVVSLNTVLNQLGRELGADCARFVWFAFILAIICFCNLVVFMKAFHKRSRTFPRSTGIHGEL